MIELEGKLGKSYVESARSDLQHYASAVDANARKIEQYSVELVSMVESYMNIPEGTGKARKRYLRRRGCQKMNTTSELVVSRVSEI